MATKYPPLLSLGEAIDVIKSMYAEHQSREVSIDLMPAILKAKPTSSGFPMRISALQRFGFIDKRPNDLLWLTDLAMQIINPIGDEAFEAKVTAFRKIDVLSDLLLHYPNGKLPSAEQLQQSLLKTYRIERERVKQWYDFVVDSFKAIPELSGKQTVVGALPSTPGQPATSIQTVRTMLSERQVLPSGKGFEYTLENGYTSEDLDYVIGLFELKKRTMK
jgi:hypothetical protein